MTTTIEAGSHAAASQRKRLHRIARLERRLQDRLLEMHVGARRLARHYRAARRDLLELVKLRPWEARGLPSWSVYARQLFGTGERQLERELAAARVDEVLHDGQSSDLPEWLLRPLTARDLTDDDRRAIWDQARAEGPPTPRRVREVAETRRRERHFAMLSASEQRQVIELDEQQRAVEHRRALARRDADDAAQAIDYFGEAIRAYERGLGYVRRAGKRIARIEDGTRRILDHVRAALDGTQQLLDQLRRDGGYTP